MDSKHHRHRSHHSRSRSPAPRHSSSHHHRHRSPSRDRHHKRTRTASPPVLLPFNAPPLTKHALDDPHVRDIFADYLDIQKSLILPQLSTRESKGRFKRFVTHYNRGELARGWYDRVLNQRGNSDDTKPEKKKQRVEEPAADDDSEDEVVGPFLPGHEPTRRGVKAGPTAPTLQDLDLQREQTTADAALAHADLRADRKLDRKAQLLALDELIPRADPGSRERRIEKKKEVNEKMRSFREKSADVELDDSTLMGGGGEGGTEGFKQKKAALERKKNDRELRKEQLLRARIAEREERLQMHRVKEEKTMAMLKQLATKFH